MPGEGSYRNTGKKGKKEKKTTALAEAAGLEEDEEGFVFQGEEYEEYIAGQDLNKAFKTLGDFVRKGINKTVHAVTGKKPLPPQQLVDEIREQRKREAKRARRLTDSLPTFKERLGKATLRKRQKMITERIAELEQAAKGKKKAWYVKAMDELEKLQHDLIEEDWRAQGQSKEHEFMFDDIEETVGEAKERRKSEAKERLKAGLPLNASSMRAAGSSGGPPWRKK